MIVVLLGAACGGSNDAALDTDASVDSISPSSTTPLASSGAPGSVASAASSVATQPPSANTIAVVSTLPGDADLYPQPLLVYPRSCRTYQTQGECDANEPVEETFSAAEVTGEISIHDDCVFLRRNDVEVVVIFPYGTQWDDARKAVILNSGEAVVDGDSIYGGGGGGSPGPLLEEHFGRELAAGIRRCLAVPGVEQSITELGWRGTVEKAAA